MLVSGKTKLDILLVPLTCLLTSFAFAYVAYPFIWLIDMLGKGIAAASLPLTLYGAFNLLNAGADVLVSLRALAARGLLLDHPSRCGFYAFSRA